MARPRADQAGPSARERIEWAFWELLEQSPGAIPTVRRVAQEADVNHNTFYYHFDSIEDLVRQGLRTVTVEYFFRVVSEGVLRGEPDLSLLEEDESFEASYRRVRLLVRSGSGAFMRVFQDEVLSRWQLLLGIRLSELSASERAKVQYLWGGVTAVIASDAAPTLAGYVAVLNDGIGEACFHMIRGILAARGIDAEALRSELS